MNSFVAKVKHIQNRDNLNIVNFTFGDSTLSMMSLGLTSKLQVGSVVKLTVKATHITIAKEFSGLISDANILQAKIVAVDNGELLSSVKLLLQGIEIESIITSEVSQKMNLQKDDNVTIFISPSELSIVSIF